MSLKFFKPVTSGMRGKVGVIREEIWKGSPFKPLTSRIVGSGGRNNQGRMTSRHRRSNCRAIYREISFKRVFLDGVDAVVERIEYDPNRTAYIALLKYKKEKEDLYCYIIASKGMKVGDIVSTSYSGRTDYSPGNCMKLKYVKDGSTVYCVELKIGKGACLARSAGSSAQVLGTDEKGRVILKLSSGELKAVNKECTACIGAVSNEDHSNIVLGKAGASYYRGIRPKVRGIAMNPVDHPNGGRANGGCHFSSPTGVCAKGKKTRRNKRTSGTIIKGRKR